MLCKQGSVVFAGPRAQVVAHFTGIGYEFDPNSNPAEFILDVCAGGVVVPTTDPSSPVVQKSSRSMTTVQLKECYRRSELAMTMWDRVALAVSKNSEVSQCDQGTSSQSGKSFMSMSGILGVMFSSYAFSHAA